MTQRAFPPSLYKRRRETSLNVTVDIAGMKVSGNPDEVLITYSLGSCVGLSLYDPRVRIGGMLHAMLPLSIKDVEKAARTPCMYVDTGVKLLLEAMFDMGATKEMLVAKAAGSGSPINDMSMFKIGERNRTVLRKILWKNNILLAAEECGGTQARTMLLYIGSGQTTIKSKGREVELI